MFFDDIRDIGFTMAKTPLADAVVFRVEETLETGTNTTWQFVKKNMNIANYPQRLPFKNCCLQFTDALLWFTEMTHEDDRMGEVCISIISPELANFVKSTLRPPVEVPEWILVPFDITSLANYRPILYCPWERKKSDYDELPEEIQIPITWLRSILFRFLTILSCKNIRKVKHDHDAKIQRKRATKNKLPLVSYYTLQLGPVSATGEAQGDSRWSNRIHLVRGHMREYTKDAPLFGRVVGRFWINQHARGNKKKGIIVKDYELPSAR